MRCLQLLPLLSFSLTITLFPAMTHAMGTHEDQSEDIFDLGEITISASTISPIEAGETVHEISAAEIKSSNARTVDEALVLLSDVNIKVGGRRCATY